MSDMDRITKMRGSTPPFVIRMDRIASTATRTVAERAMLLASVRWVNEKGRIWASLANWATMAGVTVRTAQRALRSLVERGLVRVVRESLGGSHMTSEYEIVCLAQNPDAVSGFAESSPSPAASNPDAVSGLEPRHSGTATPTTTHPNPDKEAPEPRHNVTQSSKEQPRERPTTGGGVVSHLSLELQNHPNATPERRAWIERDAPKKDDPEAWAASCIRGGWNPPADSAAVKAAKQAEWEQLLTEFDQMSTDEREAIVREARRKYPNMNNLDQSDRTFRVAGIANILKQHRQTKVAMRQRCG